MYTGKNKLYCDNVKGHWTPALMAFLALINTKYRIQNKDRETYHPKPTEIIVLTKPNYFRIGLHDEK
jgi:hypothetical protein